MLVALGNDTASQFREDLLSAIKSAAIEKQFNPYIELFETAKPVLFRIEDENAKDEILFLDIDLADVDGIETAHRIRAQQTENEIILIAKDKARVLEAFDVDALHYIIKDETSTEKIEEICCKAIIRTVAKRSNILRVTCAGETRFIAIDTIRYFEVCAHILRVYYGDSFFEFYSTLGKMENALNSKGFIRIHKSFYVALKYIQSIVAKEVTMLDGTVLPIGKSRYAEIKAAWLELLNQDQI